MQLEAFSISGLKKITPVRFNDDRGYFSEVFKKEWFCQNVAEVDFVQDNESLSAVAGTVRGLHFQSEPFAQAKLVRCVQGRLMDVAVDIRSGSPTFGKWTSVELSALNGEQLWIPQGFAHGFMTLEDNTIISYKVSANYNADHDRGIRWNDPAIGIRWPDTKTLVMSRKDMLHPLLSELPEYFTYTGTGNC
ncbi:dTDP-4-dehydrorhamnose 3,5-epimerase [uncultured Agrobacterium sp.]|uniref:dTDP-4-dehydrorhamnose 3,5-epimerase n=1 Tax=uncultured Agrobacterium sp. TaxID=157277 RepID=UPI0025DBFD0D|nr:dTDP-4-dehydrorhamnose 3,5-epimerase [uncultured Agrobacterium sp.]